MLSVWLVEKVLPRVWWLVALGAVVAAYNLRVNHLVNVATDKVHVEYAEARKVEEAKQEAIAASIKFDLEVAGDRYDTEKQTNQRNRAATSAQLNGLLDVIAAYGSEKTAAATDKPGTDGGAQCRVALGEAAATAENLAGDADDYRTKIIGLQDYVKACAKLDAAQ